jgi:hypothetical protein
MFDWNYRFCVLTGAGFKSSCHVYLLLREMEYLLGAMYWEERSCINTGDVWYRNVRW